MQRDTSFSHSFTAKQSFLRSFTANQPTPEPAGLLTCLPEYQWQAAKEEQEGTAAAHTGGDGGAGCKGGRGAVQKENRKWKE